MYITPRLRPLAAFLLDRLPQCAHPWGGALAFVLRTRLLIACPLPRRLGGITIPLLPLVLINRRWLEQSLPLAENGTVGLALVGGKLLDERACDVAQLLLHECAHQLWAIWPEWKLWPALLTGLLCRLLRLQQPAWLTQIYGVRTNAADAVSEALCRELCWYTRYSGQAISYRSPLARLHAVFRR